MGAGSPGADDGNGSTVESAPDDGGTDDGNDAVHDESAGAERATDQAMEGGDGVLDEFESRFSAIEGYSATVHVETAGGSSTTEVWHRPSTGEYRREVVAPANRAGSVIAVNGTSAVSYHPTQNNYVVANRSQFTTGLTTDVRRQYQALFDRYDGHYNGTATVDGERTHVVTYVESDGPGAGTGQLHVRLWLDDETYFPVKQRAWLEDSDLEPTTLEYENVTLNPGIDDERFEFDPPAGATREELQRED